MLVQRQERCPRCTGRLVEQGDHYGRYRSCLTCGYVDECWQGAALGFSDPRAGPERRRQPSHRHLTL